MKVKEIKVKQSDGTFSTSYPIGVNGENVDLEEGKNLEQKLDEIKEELNDLGIRIQNLNTEISESINNAIQNLGTGIDTLSEQLNTKTQELKNEFDTLSNRVQELDTNFSNKIQGLETELNNLSISLSNLTTKVDTLETDLGKLKTSINNIITNTIPNIEQNIQSLKTSKAATKHNSKYKDYGVGSFDDYGHVKISGEQKLQSDMVYSNESEISTSLFTLREFARTYLKISVSGETLNITWKDFPS